MLAGGGAGGARAGRTMVVTLTARLARTPWRPAVVAWALWALTMLGFPVVTWLDQLLRRAGRPDLALWRPDTGPQVLALVSAATVGAVLASRRSGHPVGWLLLALGLLLVADGWPWGMQATGCWPGRGRCRWPTTWPCT
jgi:hypothetical protein